MIINAEEISRSQILAREISNINPEPDDKGFISPDNTPWMKGSLPEAEPEIMLTKKALIQEELRIQLQKIFEEVQPLQKILEEDEPYEDLEDHFCNFDHRQQMGEQYSITGCDFSSLSKHAFYSFGS